MDEEPRRYDLRELYAGESAFRQYRRMIAGERASTVTLIWHEIVLTLLGSLPGLLGIALRRLCYGLLFPGLRGAFLGKSVALRSPHHVCLGRDVMIDDHVQLFATSRAPAAIELGDGCFVRSFASLNAGPPDGYIRIGKGSSIGQYVLLYGNGGLDIGENVMIAGFASVIASSHNYDEPDIPINAQGYTARGIHIEDNVWIGAGARILDGVTIGCGAIVGANAVVNRSVAPGTRVGGVPARVLS